MLKTPELKPQDPRAEDPELKPKNGELKTTKDEDTQLKTKT